MTPLPFFFNQCLDKGRLKRMILWSLAYQGEYNTIQFIENLKTIGFQHATYAGVSLGIDDLCIPPKKQDEVIEAEYFVQQSTQGQYRGNRTAIEGLQAVIDTWHRTSETVKDHVVDYFKSTDILNPVYMMAFSGARGNVSQVRQLVGMRGLMADPQGNIIGFPIRSNFREGLTITEYMISCYGARKGVVDTALRTADAGYLTRRLVDVAQHVVVQKGSCGTHRGIYVEPIEDRGKVVLSIEERLFGRVLASNFMHQGRVVARRNESISEALAAQLAQLVQSANQSVAEGKTSSRPHVRSPLTCESAVGVCRLCYGWSLAQNAVVTIGEAVGIIAGQSIGEPGTQLTMRTFHTGGVFTGEVDEEFRSTHGGWVTYPKPFQGQIVRTAYGQIAFLVKTPGIMLISNRKRRIQSRITVPIHTALFVREGEYVRSNQVIGQLSDHVSRRDARLRTKKIVFSKLAGEVVYYNTLMGDAPLPTRYHLPSRPFHRGTAGLGTIWILAGDRLGSAARGVLPMYQASGHTLKSGFVVKRATLSGVTDGIVWSTEPQSVKGRTSDRPLPLPPTLTRRLTQGESTTPLNNARGRVRPALKALYLPFFIGQFQSMEITAGDNYTRILAPTGDCLKLGNTAIQAMPQTTFGPSASTANNSQYPPETTPTQGGSAAPPTVSATLYPALFKTESGGFFWAKQTFLGPLYKHGVLQWTPCLHFGVTGRAPLTPARRKWSRVRIAHAKTKRAASRKTYTSGWVVRAREEVWSSMTLQNHAQRAYAPTYGVVCARQTPLILESRSAATEPIIRNFRVTPDATLNPLTARHNQQYAVQNASPQPNTVAVWSEFPFSERGFSTTRSVPTTLHPGWVSLAPPSLFNPRVSAMNPVASDIFQSFRPALVDAQSPANAARSPHRRVATIYAKMQVDVRAWFSSSTAVSRQHLTTFRALSTLRHPELLQFLLHARGSSLLKRAYRAASKFYICVHKASPWFYLLQPRTMFSTRGDGHGSSIYTGTRYMGWVYKATHGLSPAIPVPQRQTHAVPHSQFNTLLRETCVVVYVQTRAYSLDQLTRIQCRYNQMQALEARQTQYHDWRVHFPAWVKQEQTPIVPQPGTTLDKLETKMNLFIAPCRQHATNPTCLIRMVSGITVPRPVTGTQLAFGVLPRTNPFNDNLWSFGAMVRPPFSFKPDTVLGAYGSVRLAHEPAIVRARRTSVFGESFVTPDQDVILLSRRDVYSFSSQNIAATSLRISIGQLVRYGEEIAPGVAVPVSGQILAITPTQIHIRRGQPVLFYKSAALHVRNRQWIQLGHPIVTLTYQRLVTGDIVQGIPKVEQLFEASRSRDAEVNLHRLVRLRFRALKRSMVIGKASRKTIAYIQRQIIDRIQRIYISQGVSIADKHFEVIVRQMTSFVRVLNPGDTGLFRNEIIPLSRAENVNAGTFKRKARYEPAVLGITAAALNSNSFLSAASFQETTRVLTRDSMLNKVDFLRGLKERVILGDLIPAGTGLTGTVTYQALTSPLSGSD